MEVKGLNLVVNGQKHVQSIANNARSRSSIEENKEEDKINLNGPINVPKKQTKPITQSKSRPAASSLKKSSNPKNTSAPTQSKSSNQKNTKSNSQAKPKKPGSIPCDIINLSNRTFEVLRGPILLTAPHGIQIFRGQDPRGGAMPDDRVRLHQRERYTTQIAIRITKHIEQLMGGGSFCVWNEKVAQQKDKSNLDPNYLVAEQFGPSQWNQCLQRLKYKMINQADLPTFHVDLHGKMKRKNGRIELDVGIEPMWQLVDDQDFVQKCLDAFTEELRAVMAWINPSRSVPFEVEPDPHLHGFWGHDCNTTISHQSVLYDMPAIQFEMPPEIRHELVHNEEFLRRFSHAIVNAYRTIYDLDQERWDLIWLKMQEVSQPHPGLLPGYDEFLEFVATVDKRITVF